jgi:hypothetical protein
VGFSEVLFEVFKWVSHERSIKIYLKHVKTSLDYFPRLWIGRENPGHFAVSRG